MLSILITHYNRVHELKVLLSEIDKLGIEIPYEIVVSDDGSTGSHLEKLLTLKIDNLVLSKINTGLATNLNKGLLACKGKYILYCQEDYLIKNEFKEVLNEAIGLLGSGKLDMIRFRSNYKFPVLKKISRNIGVIPKFSFKNFKYNTFKYSDNPFITTRSFYDKVGFYLENTSGPYGETEYAIRVLTFNVKIGIGFRNYFIPNTKSESVMMIANPIRKRNVNKSIIQYARAIRQHFEWIMYNKSNRKLITYKNNYIKNN